MNNELRRKMSCAIDALLKDFGSLRTGRASISMLDHVFVDSYGSKVPINQVATINIPDSRQITLELWDKNLLKNVEIAIRDSDIGLAPVVDGKLVRIIIPELNEERRKEIAKLAGKYAESAKVSIRNIRREGMDELKKSEKNKEISEDEHKRLGEKIQKLTDEYIEKIDKALADKEFEVMKIG